jgi:hypothetical protein
MKKTFFVAPLVFAVVAQASEEFSSPMNIQLSPSAASHAKRRELQESVVQVLAGRKEPFKVSDDLDSITISEVKGAVTQGMMTNLALFLLQQSNPVALTIDQSYVPSDIFSKLTPALEQAKIKELHIRNINIFIEPNNAGESLNFLGCCLKSPVLRKLTLSDCGLKSLGAHILKDEWLKSCLESVDFKQNEIPENERFAFNRLASGHKTLTSIDVRNQSSSSFK